MELVTVEHDHVSLARLPDHTRNRTVGCLGQHGVALVAVQQLEGHAESATHVVEGALAPKRAVGDVTERALDPSEEVERHVLQLAGEGAVGVVDADQAGDVHITGHDEENPLERSRVPVAPSGNVSHLMGMSIESRPANAELHRMARERLTDRDQRYTTGRKVIVDALAAAGAPVTLPELLRQEPSLAQSSAYRNLALMEEAGVVRRLLHGGEHAHYELAEDLTEHHHHLICEECGLIRDITLDATLERSLDRAFEVLAGSAGFAPRHHAIDVYGRCADCAA